MIPSYFNTKILTKRAIYDTLGSKGLINSFWLNQKGSISSILSTFWIITTTIMKSSDIFQKKFLQKFDYKRINRNP